MGVFFITKLPAGHAILSMTRAAASSSLTNESAFGAVIAPGVDETRRQCAAMSWLLSDIYSQANFQKLTAASRVYALQLCGLDAGGRAAAQAARLHAHLIAHHPALVGQGGGGGGGGGGSSGGGGGGAGSGQGGAGGGGAGGGGGGGGQGPAAPPGDDTGGFAPALLPPPQLVALLALPCAKIKKLLDAAGVPHGAGILDSEVRSKGAAAAWAAEKLRSVEEVLALPDGVQARLFGCFDIPTAWRPEARRASLLTLLQTCRDSAWALDPELSGGLVNLQRSELFRLAERLSATKQVATTTPDQVLSAEEQAQLRATLAAAGYSDSDLSYQQGQWRLGSAPSSSDLAAGGSASRYAAAPARQVEAELRTLWVSAYTLLTSSERKDQATRYKSVAGTKRSRAYPGDEETDCQDATLNPFAEWPWEQILRLTPDTQYKRAGRLLRNALRWCNKFSTDLVMKMTYAVRSSAADKLYEQFSSAVSSGSHDLALLLAFQARAVAEATEQMQCILVNAQVRSGMYPGSAFIVHVARRRQAQAADLKIFLADIATRVTYASKAHDASSICWFPFAGDWDDPCGSSKIPNRPRSVTNNQHY
jgi:hypothetical protein